MAQLAKYRPETGVIGSYDDPKAVMTAQKEPTEQYMAGRPWIKVEMTQLAKYRPLSGSHLAEECKGARRQVLAEEYKETLYRGQRLRRACSCGAFW